MLFRLYLGLHALATMVIPVASLPSKLSGCDLKGLSIQGAPAGLPEPTAPLSYVSIALGTQNYTCTEAGNYTAAGALAQLFDISCLSTPGAQDDLADSLWAFWKQAPPFLSTQAIIAVLLPVNAAMILGQHYFIPNPITGQGVSPKWDFTSQGATKGNPEAYVVAALAAGVPAPNSQRDVDWLALNSISGSLSKQVYRTDTRGGYPPGGTCRPGSTITIKYVSKYWFYGSTL
ncbi:hypothetical protein CC1G_03495 [Coprinopsis cinerea okayama7|uniref:Malate dehydrogenase n=1 Tax=Coprinopsis cinerea (strain Okayama-7 / 130 / ATCC MYA-4618 / FGSC 9003) TaxID=240176 RepID=A8NCD7_COPC7|nr:hypothetical protein CC1G_03495 [Coprinopsis cinerea okayama7\|eukprot:XP_001832481.1 hypothetical protein CC1G_03495 [Coprinopsis cinerea okayama7\